MDGRVMINLQLRLEKWAGDNLFLHGIAFETLRLIECCKTLSEANEALWLRANITNPPVAFGWTAMQVARAAQNGHLAMKEVFDNALRWATENGYTHTAAALVHAPVMQLMTLAQLATIEVADIAKEELERQGAPVM